MRTLSLPVMSLLVFSFILMTLKPSYADEGPEQHVSLKDHNFVPKVLNLPQGQKIKLVITNEDPTPAEFESYDLHREKVVGANASITVFVGPLDAGQYSFFDDFHRDTTTGTLIVK